MTRVSALMRLQQVDAEIDRYRARLAEIEATLARDQGLAEAGAALSGVQATLAATRRSMRALEADVKSIADKAGEVEAALYGGRVTNPKELRDLQEELDSLKRRRSTLEDQLLETMVQVDAEEAGEDAARQNMAGLEQSLHHVRDALAADKTQVEAALARLAFEREAAEGPVPPADRQLYQSLRKRKRGLAVARLEEGVCSACGVAPSSSRAQASRHGDEIIFCGNCERILYGE